MHNQEPNAGEQHRSEEGGGSEEQETREVKAAHKVLIQPESDQPKGLPPEQSKVCCDCEGVQNCVWWVCEECEAVGKMTRMISLMLQDQLWEYLKV